MSWPEAEHRTAEEIAGNRKSVRYLSRCFCPKDGRLLGAVVIFEGRPHLWLPGGGRLGNHRDFLVEVEELRDSIPADINQAHENLAGGYINAETHAAAVEESEDALRRISALVEDVRASGEVPKEPGRAFPVENWTGWVRAGEPTYETRAVCPGCGRRIIVRLDPDTLDLGPRPERP